MPVPLDVVPHILRIVRAKPDIPPWEAWSLAVDYRRAELKGWSTELLDEYLAFEPWADEGEQYVTAAEADALAGLGPMETASTVDRIRSSAILEERWRPVAGREEEPK